jgi:hypothetical protein
VLFLSLSEKILSVEKEKSVPCTGITTFFETKALHLVIEKLKPCS